MLPIKKLLSRRTVKRNLKQVSAIIERNFYLQARFKINFLLPFIRPLIAILMPLIIFGTIFAIQDDFQFGYWKSDTYILFILMAYCIQFLRPMIVNIRQTFVLDKFWKTLQALMVAPVNRFNILIGSLFAEIIFISIPLSTFVIITYILFPISIFNLLLVLVMIFFISLIFGSLGLIASILFISKEEIYKIFDISLTLVFWLSCISYPFYIFPEFFRLFILINPFYYLFDTFRLVWYIGVDFNIAINYLTPLHIIVVSFCTILLPIIAVYLFNTFYKKYGITGY